MSNYIYFHQNEMQFYQYILHHYLYWRQVYEWIRILFSLVTFYGFYEFFVQDFLKVR